MQYFLSILAVSLGLAWGALGEALADQLITDAEAALPAPPDVGLVMRGITRGPAIEQVEPAPSIQNLKSPLPLKIQFTAHNNTTVDKDSIKVTYVKSPAVDLTARLKSHFTDDGIAMAHAEVPPGTHVIRIEVKDSRGRASTAMIKLLVVK